MRTVISSASARRRTGCLLSTGISACLLSVSAAHAQDAPEQGTGRAQDQAGAALPGEILVTARKRDETAISVPVTITAVGAGELDRRGIASLDSLTRIVPQLMIGSTGGSVQGGNVVVRGLAGADSNPFADQAVSFNVDGVQVARANIRRMAETDLAQIEVLKGPQALFFGKNSPGGIISMRTADPTNSLFVKGSLGYEFNAREWRGEGAISGPITDTLGLRLAAYGSTMGGWMDNGFADTSIYAPAHSRLPKTREFATRLTAKWEPSDRFSARFKFGYAKLKDSGLLGTQERIDCPSGAPQLGGGPDDCRPNGKMARRDLGPVLATLDSRYPANGEPYLKQEQVLSSLELNYNLSDTLKLTSVTGYYWLRSKFADDFNLAYDPNFVLPNAGSFGVRELSQELRLASDFDGPINFMVGGFYQHAKADVSGRTFIGKITPRQLNNYFLAQEGDAYSAFAQVTFNPIEQIELSAGGRYSYEKKRLTTVESSPGSPGAPLPVAASPLAPRTANWNNFSPEFTVAYKPHRDLNIFATYKHGFLSGGFNSGASNFANDLRFDQQVIKGFEGGIKAALLDGALRTNLSVYSYKVTGLQVTTSRTDAEAGTIQQVTNAGKVSVKGAEFDFTYRTPIDGVQLRGAIAYNDGKYDRFSVNCYRGQTQALGCNAGDPNSSGLYQVQDLGGARLVKAPKWTGSAGIGYSGDIGADLTLGVNVDASFSSGYFTDVTNKPASWQKTYGMLDANIRLATKDERYEISLIGRNLTDKYYVQRTVDTPLAGSAPGGLSGVLADTQGSVNRGREIMLRVSFKYQ